MTKPRLISETGITIDKGVPLPKHANWLRAPKYPWRIMEIGDSFAVPADLSIKAFSVHAHKNGKQLGLKFSVRKTDSGYRCWRIA